METIIKWLGISVVSALLIGCGGGGSDSDSGGGSSSASRSFSGTETVTVTFSDLGQSNTGTFPVMATITGDTITITDESGTQYSGDITGNTFTARGVQQLGDVAPGVRCGDITLTYTGTINGDQITGTSEGASPCDAGAVRTTTTQKGSFTVSV